MTEGTFASLLAGLSIEEKASLLDGSDFWRTTPVARLDVPAAMLSDGPHGLRKQPSGGDLAGLLGSVPATCFPPAAGLASSWDPELVGRVGAALALEARAEQVAVLLGPGVNMKRSPLCGRNFEYFAEDPLLAGTLASAFVRAVQEGGVGTALKHYAANNQETDRMTISAEVDERTLREIYLPAFEQVVVTAKPWTVMCSYNRVNGVYASEDPWLLTDVLRTEWGFDGLVMSDWGAVNDRAAGVAAGLDLEMPSSSGAGTRRILDALSEGTLAHEQVDRAAANVLTLLDRARPLLDGAPDAGSSPDFEAQHAVAREAALASAVLLKNDGGLLPLDADGSGAVAVIGELARSPRYQGAGSSQVNPTRVDVALDSLRAALAGRREVRFAPGYVVGADQPDPQLVSEAVEAAAGADVVVLFLGLPPQDESEGWDRTHIDLPSVQTGLLAEVVAANPRVVVVLSNGSAVAVDPWQARVPALVEGWLLGQAGGSATADLLLGAANFSGRLAETIPVRLADNPAVGAFPGEHGRVRYGEGLLIGYRWYDAHQVPVGYPFGHGLSYTSFDYDDLVVDVLDGGPEPRVRVSASVTNTGDRAGTETVQLYVHHGDAPVFRPEQELRAFARIALEPGVTERVELHLTGRAFAYWHDLLHRWHVAPGSYEVRVGSSSRDCRLRGSVSLDGEPLPARLTADADAGTWLSDPDAGPWLEEVLTGQDLGELLLDPDEGRMLRAIPMARLARMPGTGLDEDVLAEAVARFGAEGR